MFPFRNTVVPAFVLSAVVAGHAAAQISFGSPNTTVQANCLPFGCPTGHLDVQQIYAASGFSGPVSINSITFYNSRGTGNFASGTFSFYLSTTSASPTAPGATPAANVTSPQQFFGTLVTGGAAAPASFTITGAPFVYNPSQGNLLLDVRNPGIGFNFSQAFFDVVMSAQVGRTTDSGVVGTDTRANYGLVTTFGVTPAVTTPEPATLALVAGGLGVLSAGAWRRRRA